MKKGIAFLLIFVLLGMTACAADYSENVGTIDLSRFAVTGAGIAVEGNIVKITQGGDFTVTGTSENGMIYVETTDKVKLRLSGMNLTNPTGPAIYFEDADKALITITEGTINYVADGSEHETEGTKAAIFSNDDMEIKGKGTLYVTGNFKHGIASDDGMVIENGTIFITAVSDGLHTNKDFEMRGGSLSIACGKQGVQAEGAFVMDGGSLCVTESYEGIESGTTMTFNGGTVDITASDDGLNSGGGLNDGAQGEFMPNRGGMRQQWQPDGQKEPLNFEEGGRGQAHRNEMQPPRDMGFPQQSAKDCDIFINGGTITIDAGGDGIDSNASIYMTGGTVYVNGPTSNGDGAIDGDTFYISGGTMIAVGSSGMAMGAAQSSEQNGLKISFSTQKAGSTLVLKNSAGEELMRFTPKKAYASLVYSSDKLQTGETYTLYADDAVLQTVTATEKQTSAGTGNRGGFEFGGGGQGFDRPQMQRPEQRQPQQSEEITVYHNGKQVWFDTQPIVQNGTTLVPLRAIFEELGMMVSWNAETQTVTAEKGDVYITLTVGQTAAAKNGEEILLNAPPVLQDGRTLVPVRFIAESLGLTVDWDEGQKQVLIRE